MTFSPIVKRYVYLIKKNNLVNGKMSIKIGFSKEPQRRLKELQTCNDSKLSILTTQINNLKKSLLLLKNQKN